MNRKQIVYFAIVSLGLVAFGAAVAEEDRQAADADRKNKIVPLANAHAHNDYYHRRPLFDALACGFGSVEADVFLIDGRLLVGHERNELRPERSLQALYLDPLRERIEANKGSVYAERPEMTFWLHIDVKNEARPAFEALQKTLAEYADMLTVVEDGKVKPGPVQVVVSGSRNYKQIAAANPRYAGIDGRMGDLESELPPHLLPLLSDAWRTHFQWSGWGEMPAEEREKLRNMVAKAHAAGRKVRFWATPEQPELWRELRAAKVDFINTNRLEALRDFLLEEEE